MKERQIQMELLSSLLELLERFQSGGPCGPIDNPEEWNRKVHSHAPEQQELLQELTRFVDLCRYMKERGQDLGPDILAGLREAPLTAISDRIRRIREINQKLMERIPYGSENPGSWN